MNPARPTACVGFFVGPTRCPAQGWDMFKLMLIFVGGGLGSLCRYGLSGWGQRLANGSFPLGTLIVNVLGCFVIGLLNYVFSGSAYLIRPEYRIALTIGVLGGFTTFSTFGWETFAMANDGQGLRAVMNLLLSVTLGFSAVLVGYRLGEKWFGAG